MKAIHSLVIAAVAFVCGQSAPAQTGSDCRLRIEAARTSWIIKGYDPFGLEPPIDEFDVTFVNAGADACQVAPSFDLAGEPFGLDQGAAPRIHYSLLDRTDDRDLTPRTGASAPDPTRPLLVVDGHGEKLARFRLSVERQGILGDGIFVQDLRLDAKNSEGAVLASRQLQLGLDVQPTALVGLAGTFRQSQGRAVVDLGELHQGIAPTLLNLYVQSTRPYIITMESQNSGYLKLANSNWAVPYQIFVFDRAMNLRGVTEYSSTLGTALSRQSIPIKFAIGETANLQAGKYGDVITVSIAPR